MNTLFVKFKGNDKTYTYNSIADFIIGDVIHISDLGSDVTVVDVIDGSNYRYICKRSGELKENRDNVNDIMIKNIHIERVEVITRFIAKYLTV